MTQNKSKQTAFLRFSLEFLCVFFLNTVLMPIQLTIVFLKWILLHCFCISCGTENAKSYWFLFQKQRQWFVFAFRWSPIEISPKFTQKRGLCTCSGVYVALCGWAHRHETQKTHFTCSQRLASSQQRPKRPSIQRNQTQFPDLHDHLRCTDADLYLPKWNQIQK